MTIITVMLSIPALASGISAECAILIDCGTGRVFYEKEADRPHLIASTTKIMTALAALENCAPDEKVKVTRDALTEGSSMYLREGEELTVEELLYGLMLMSGNDAAAALAIHCGGFEHFTALMNEKAQKIGLERTHFSNPHGLDAPDNYSTARDLARLAAYAMENEFFRKICGTRSIYAANRSMTNHNRLLETVDGVIGVKTGFTKTAGRCLVSCCERNGRRLVLVTLNDPDDWRDHAILYDAAFGAMEEYTVAEKGKTAAEVPIASGGSAELFFCEELKLWLTPDERKELEVKIMAPQFFYNVPQNFAGTVEFYLHGAFLGEVCIVNKEAL